MSSRELKIKGMSCQHCVMSLTEALNTIKMLKVVDVQIGTARVDYNSDEVTEEQVRAAVKEAGFELIS